MKLQTHRDARAHRASLIACCIAGTVAAGNIWFDYSSFGTVDPRAPLIDFTIVGYGTFLLLKLQRNLVLGTIIAVLLFIGGTFGMFVKYWLTWSPVSFGDLLLLPDLFGFYGTRPLLGVGVALFVFIALFLANLQIPHRGDIPLLVPALLVALLLMAKAEIPAVSAATTESTLFSRPDLPAPFYLGHWGTLAASTYRFADRYSEARRLRETFGGKTAAYPDFTATHLADAQRRNVYIVLVESLFNPHEIDGVTFSGEPLAPPFDSWMRRGGAHAMSPVFGGRSADAEFEILCGLPANLAESTVLFAQLTATAIDCLPAKLGRLGWSAVSTVPVPGSFFSAESAYRRIGFTDSIFIDQLDDSDQDGTMISAQSLLQQQIPVVERLLAEKRPFFSYVFLTSGHFPYPLDPKRPKTIAVAPPGPMVEDYVNTVYYNTLAVGRYIEAIRKRDPTALIVTLGDHPPALFPEHQATEYPGQANRTHQVPLLIFDGTAGEVPLTGWVPDYQLPEIILDRLTDGRFCATNRCYRAERYWIRSTGTGVTLVDSTNGQLLACDTGAAECAAAAPEIAFWKSRIYDLIGLP